jgi:hypothetical protein
LDDRTLTGIFQLIARRVHEFQCKAQVHTPPVGYSRDSATIVLACISSCRASGIGEYDIKARSSVLDMVNSLRPIPCPFCESAGLSMEGSCEIDPKLLAAQIPGDAFSGQAHVKSSDCSSKVYGCWLEFMYEYSVVVLSRVPELRKHSGNRL